MRNVLKNYQDNRRKAIEIVKKVRILPENKMVRKEITKTAGYAIGFYKECKLRNVIFNTPKLIGKYVYHKNKLIWVYDANINMVTKAYKSGIITKEELKIVTKINTISKKYWIQKFDNIRKGRDVKIRMKRHDCDIAN